MSRGKKLVSDTLIYGTFTILQRFLSFFMMPLYVRYLDKGDYGNITNIFAIIAIMMVIYSFGFENAFYRFYNDDKKERVFSTSFLFVVFWGAILSGILIAFNSFIFPFIGEAENIDEMVLYASIVLFIDIIMLVPFANLRMERKTIKFSIYKFLTILIAIGCNIYFIAYKGKSGEYAFISQIIASSIGVLILLPIIFKNFTLDIKSSLYKEMIRYGLPTVPASASTLLLRSGDHILIPHLAENGKEALAEYAANYKLALPMMMFVTTFDYAWKPFYLSSYKEPDAKQFFTKVLNIFVFVACLIFLLVTFFIQDIVAIEIFGKSILPEDYQAGLRVIPYAMGGYFLLGLFNFFSMGLNIEKKTKFFPRAVGVAVVFNIVANIVLIPIYGYMASAWITLISYFISTFIIFKISKIIYPLNYNYKKIAGLIAITLLLFSVKFYTDTISFGFVYELIMIFAFVFFGFALNVLDKKLILRILKRKRR